MKPCLFCSFLMFISLNLSAQSWDPPYQRAVASYQKGDVQSAFAFAQEAVELLEQDVAPETGFYIYQILTTSALELGEYQSVLDFIEKEKNASKAAFGETEKYLQALKKEAQALLYSNQLDQAGQVYVNALEVSVKLSGEKSTETLLLKVAHAQLLSFQRKWSQAKDNYQVILEDLKTNPETSEDYLFSLFAAGQADFRLESYESAIQHLSDFIQMVEANNLQQIEEYPQAKDLLELCRLETGKLTEESELSTTNLSSLLKNALLAQEEGRVNDASLLFDKADLAIANEGIVSKSAFSIYFNYVELLLMQGELARAENMLDKAFSMAEELFARYSYEKLRLHQLSARLTYLQKNISLLKPALDSIFSIAIHTEASESFNTLKYAFKMYEELGMLPTAWGKVEMLFTNANYSQGLNEAQQSEFLQLFVGVATLNNKSSHALQILEDGEFSFLKSNNQWDISIARLLFNNGKYDVTEQVLLEGLPKVKGNPGIEPLYYELLAINYQKKAAYAKAEEYFKISIEAYDKLTGNSRDKQMARNSLAMFFMDLGNYEKAEGIFNELIKESTEATILQNLAALYQITGRTEGSISLLEKALYADSVQYGIDHPNFALTLQNLASAYKTVDQIDKAKHLFERSLSIDAFNNDNTSVSHANKLTNYAMALQELGQLVRAEEHLLQALKIRKEKLGNTHPDYAFNLYGLAVLYQRQEKMARANDFFSEAIPIYLKQINDVFPILSEREKAAFYNKITEVVNSYQDFAINYYKYDPQIAVDLFEFRIATKAILLNASTAVRQRILNSGDQHLMGQFTEWLNLKEDLAQLYSASKNVQEDNAGELARMEHRANEIEKSLSKNSLGFANSFSSNEISLATISSQLLPSEALLEMIRIKLNIKNDSVVYAALLLKGGSEKPQMVILANGKELESKGFKRYINSIKYKFKDDESYEQYWQTINENLAGINTIYLSPDGVYNKISVATLFNNSTNQYLLEQYDIRLLTNPKSLLKPKRPANQINLTAALLGNPDFKVGDEEKLDLKQMSQKVANQRSVELLRNGIDELPGTKVEIAQINDLLLAKSWKNNLLMDASATEGAIKALQSPNLLHFATHGYFIENDGSTDEGDVNQNPLLRSGLLLSGAEKYLKDKIRNQPITAEDGMLTAYEAMNLNLSNTNLVVLSACETGVGELKNGEGVYGLQRSFLVAGADNLVMSLWKVDDQATQQLMVNFYSHWLNGEDYSKALRASQLKMQKEYPEPYYWGAFVLTK
ncbi:CHAT domain-containing protein [Marivirga sp. S37H4]|uniref:CHAT domain-containing protein n=1 Tax=Marivirga aurantiaca TaxID=2802615 RepID=A0A935CAV8_9BACT|nr:CHAT domain-containing protein [Marivirga aurantiaca]MBK6266427.1 CHAT domain-containing protein [Marivirga aurantiaca]